MDTNFELLLHNTITYENQDVDGLKEEIRIMESINRKIKSERKKLIKEQISRGTKGARVKEIDDILHGREKETLSFSREYIKRNKLPASLSGQYFKVVPMDDAIKGLKNRLDVYENRDFYFTIDNGFRRYKVKESELLKRIKSGENIGETLLKEYKSDVKKAYEEMLFYYNSNKNKFSSEKRKKVSKKVHALWKLMEKVSMNEAAMDRKSEKPLMKHKDEKGWKTTGTGAYPIIVNIVETEITIE